MTIPGKVFVPWRGYLAYALVFVLVVAAAVLMPMGWPWWLVLPVAVVWVPTSFLIANVVCRPYQPIRKGEDPR